MQAWTSSAVTEIGHRRNNEDAYLEAADLRLWAVADGMGGHAHGEVASHTALHALRGAVLDGKDLPAALAAANRATWERAHHHGSDMGTTLVALRLGSRGYEVAWLGDSRAYRFRDDRGLEQLTSDHTVVQEWVIQGLLTAEEARDHPYGHVLIRALGLDPDAVPDTREGDLAGGEIFLLCSDGLSDTLTAEQIAGVLGTSAPGESPGALARAAREAGNPYQDNLTAVVVWSSSPPKTGR